MSRQVIEHSVKQLSISSKKRRSQSKEYRRKDREDNDDDIESQLKMVKAKDQHSTREYDKDN